MDRNRDLILFFLVNCLIAKTTAIASDEKTRNKIINAFEANLDEWFQIFIFNLLQLMLVQNEVRRNAVAVDFKQHLSPLQNILDFRDNFVRFGDERKNPSPWYMEIMTTRVSKSTQMWEFYDMMRKNSTRTPFWRHHLRRDRWSPGWKNVTPSVKGPSNNLEVCVAHRIPENITNPCFSIKNMLFN